MRKSVFFLLAAMLLLYVPSAGATILGTVRGIVHDPQHRPVAGADVKLQSSTSAWSRAARTNDDGEFEFDAVPLGEYEIAVTHDGFDKATRSIVIDSGSSPVFHIPLDLAGATQRVVVNSNVENAVDTESSTTQTLIGRTEISETPGDDRTNSLQMITDYVPGAYMVHDQLHVRGGHQVSWLIDGVPVPNTSIASNVGPQFDPKDVDYLEVQRGGYSADYGDRTYGVFNVVPRTGFDFNNDADLTLTYGNYNQTNSQMSFGGHTKRFAYYASVNADRTDQSLETPDQPVLHDLGDGVGGFGSLIFNVTPNDQLRLVSSLRRDFYQVPNTPGQQAACPPAPDPDTDNCAVRDVDRETDSFANFSWVHTINTGSVLTVSPFYHFNSADYTGGPNDFPVSPLDHRSSNYAGLQSAFSYTKGINSFRAGVYVYGQHDSYVFGVASPDPDLAVARQSTGVWGNLESVFLEDQLKVTSWLALNGGVRLTHFESTDTMNPVSENAADPRIGAAITIPGLHWVLRGSYSRFYQAPPLDTVTSGLLNSNDGFGFLTLHGERDEEYEGGLAIPFRGWLLDIDYTHNAARNFLDHDVLGNSNIFFPLTIARARIRAWETTVRSPEIAGRARLHLSYSYQYAQGEGAVTGGLTDFEPPAPGLFYLDHDQRDTLSAGYNIQLPARSWTTGNLNFGSGFLLQDGPDHLPAHATFDFAIGKDFGERFSLAFTAVNIANDRFMLDTSNTFGGTHFNEPRQLIGQFRWHFHY
jgi:TonB dependent receptor/Carboxypeptidase regulatory-like domain/TonB-dependent Receptor Plug Domain